MKITPSPSTENRHWSLLKIFTDEGLVGLSERLRRAIGPVFS